MLPDLKSVQGLLKIGPIKIDNNICRCHYKLTVIFLAVSTTVITLKQYVGDPIDCIINAKKSPIPTETLDKYCWIHSTHTLPKGPGTQGFTPIPGLGTPKEDDQLVYHKYYQWVAFFLLFQAITFYLPHFAWKFWEAGRMKALVEDLHFSVVQTDVQRKAKRDLVEYLFANMHQHQMYAAAFFACELLNTINIISQIFMVDTFLGGEFTKYGANVMAQSAMDPEDRSDPMSYVFPKLTKCLFKMYGPSGTIQQYDALCILPINILNEKIFIFLWFWYVILALLTGIAFFVRVATLVVPKVRLFFLKFKAGHNFDSSHLKTVFNHCQIGDWFVLMLVSSNITQGTLQEVLQELSHKFRGKLV